MRCNITNRCVVIAAIILSCLSVWLIQSTADGKVGMAKKKTSSKKAAPKAAIPKGTSREDILKEIERRKKSK